MKMKKTFLKIMLTTLTMFMFFGVFAQVTQINHTDDVATGTNYVESVNITYQTVDLGFRLYVRPDVVYSPSYDGSGNAGTGLNTNSMWTWAYGTNFASGTAVKAAANQNWVDLLPATLPSVNTSRLYWVQESNTAFSCTDIGTSHEVFVTGAPTATILGQGNSWNTVSAGLSFNRCATGSDIGDILNITLSELGAPVLAQNYTFGISSSRTALDANLVPIVATTTDVTTTYGVTANTAALTNGLNQNHTIPALPLIDASTPTQYTFTLTTNSITSTISLRSHLRSVIANLGYNGAVTTITYTLLPVPTTGPIFHIPNAF